MMAFVAVGRGEDELLGCSALVVSGLKLTRHSRGEPVVVLRVDPEHRQVAVLVCRFAERPVGADQSAKIAVMLVPVATSAAGEVDGRLERRRRICGERDLGEAAGRDAHADHCPGIDLGQSLAILDHGAKIVGAGVSGVFEAAASGAAAAGVAVALAAGAAVSAARDDDGDVAAAGEPHRLAKLCPRRYVGALLLFV